jgi:probable phosphoglycerate mutase
LTEYKVRFYLKNEIECEHANDGCIMTLVLLVRHGENDYVKKGRLAGRLPGVHLNNSGREQAEAVANRLAELLKGFDSKVIYSSPLERTLETAQPIAERLGLEVIPRSGLLEIDIGDWQDQKIKGLSRLKLWKLVQNVPSRAIFPGGETFHHAQYRIVTELDELCRQHDEKTIIICVSHSDIIKLAVAYHIGLPLDQFQRLHVAPASVSALNVGETGSRLLTLNYESSFTFLGK